MLRVALVALCVTCVLAQTPARPVIRPEFMAEFEYRDESHNHTSEGRGHWAHDSIGRRAVDHMEEHERPGEMPHFETILWRFDEHVEYFLTGPRNQSHCEKHALNGSVPNPFGWLAQAHYQGKHEVPPHQELEVWGAKVADTTLEVGVTSENTNTPVVFMSRSSGRSRMVHFDHFTQTTPPAALFDVPESCSSRSQPSRRH
ncbi:uncharacterized protein LOC135825222 [Sycon ciliatum]|uniref:uncharacterized protein LOC135825222 n=1 Tax=Sycon ciliatum TaxID=27933 RepID=UPI0031F6B3A7|eukprot:scpid91203/ scgid13655/ 